MGKMWLACYELLYCFLAIVGFWQLYLVPTIGYLISLGLAVCFLVEKKIWQQTWATDNKSIKPYLGSKF